MRQVEEPQDYFSSAPFWTIDRDASRRPDVTRCAGPQTWFAHVAARAAPPGHRGGGNDPRDYSYDVVIVTSTSQSGPGATWRMAALHRRRVQPVNSAYMVELGSQGSY